MQAAFEIILDFLGDLQVLVSDLFKDLRKLS